MSVRQVKKRTSEGVRQFWMVDVVFEHADGRIERVRKVSPVQTKRGAEQYERELRQSLLDGKRALPAEEKEVPTFGSFVKERWWPVYPAAAGNRPMTVREKEIHLRTHLIPALGDVRLDNVRAEVLDRFFADMRKHGLSPKSCRNVSATLRRVLASAVEWGALDKLPKLPRVKVPEPRFDFFTRAESEQLVTGTRNPEERALLLFALHTGARAGEQIACERSDVDWSNKKVILRRSSTRGIVGPTKSGREKKLGLTETLGGALHAVRHTRGPLLFCNTDGRPYTLWQLHERLWGACKRAGLRRIRWHDLRHSFASQLVIAGVPLRQVQEAMGHATITMTMRYAHLAPGGADAVAKALDGTSCANGNLTATDEKEEKKPK